jgi:hypothetical protein
LTLEALEARLQPSITLSPATLPSDVVNFAYNQNITSTGGVGTTTLTYNVTHPVAGLALGGSGTSKITITGTPVATGTETFTVTARDSAGNTTGPVPYSITVSPPLVTLSYFDSAVYEFDPISGALVQTLVAPTYSPTTLNGPAGMTNGPDGNLYFSSQLNNSIVEYNVSSHTMSTFIPSSVLQSVASTFGDSNFAPAGLAFGPDNNLYVSLNAGRTATSGGAVIRFNIGATGGHLVYAGTERTVASGLVQPTELAFGVGGDQTSLYVSNSGSQATPQAYSSTPHNVIKIAGATGAAPQQTVFIATGANGLNYPSGLTWGPDGNLYVVDLGATNYNGQVLQYSPSGTFLKVFTQTGTLQYQFPSDAIFLANGNMLTANLGPSYPPNLAGSISQYDPTGAFQGTLDSSSLFPNTGPGTSGFSPSQIVLDGPQPLVLVPSSLPNAAVDAAYQQDISTVGGIGNAKLTVSKIQHAIPGLHIFGNGSNTIHVTGMPLFMGTETLEVTAKDSAGDVTVTDYSITVDPAIEFTPLFLPPGVVNSTYPGATISASGGTGGVTLAVGKVVNAISGLAITGQGTGSLQIAGTPTAAGVEFIQVTATDSSGATNTRWYAVAVLPDGTDDVFALFGKETGCLKV